jgi:hypothetical protein
MTFEKDVKFDVPIKLLGPRIRLTDSYESSIDTGPYFDAYATLLVKGDDRDTFHTIVGWGKSPEVALKELFDRIRDEYEEKSPYPPLEELRKDILNHELGGHSKINRIDIWQNQNDNVKPSISVRASTRVDVGAMKQAEKNVFFGDGDSEREALFNLLVHLHREFPKEGLYIIGAWDDRLDKFLYLKSFLNCGTWTFARDEAATFSRQEFKEFPEYLLHELGKYTTDEPGFMRKDCRCWYCRQTGNGFVAVP